MTTKKKKDAPGLGYTVAGLIASAFIAQAIRTFAQEIVADKIAVKVIFERVRKH